MEMPDELRFAGCVSEPLGLIWIKGESSITSVRLRRALSSWPRIHRGPEPPKQVPSVVICCSPERVDAPRLVSEATRIHTLFPTAAVLVLSPCLDVGLARAALRAGARGFLHTGMLPEHITRALSVASKGEIVLPRELLEAVVEEERGPDLSDLRPRQREILEVAAEGLSNAQIARRLFLSESTVKQHLTAAYKTLGVKNRRQALVLIRRSGFFRTTGYLTRSA